jgi:hypothetical protein
MKLRVLLAGAPMKSRVLLVVALATALVSCAKKHPAAPIVVVAPAGPVANSPAGAVQRLAWAVQARDTAAYTALLTDDYAFMFAPTDSAGNSFPNRCMDRTFENAAMLHMLVGGGSLPPALAVTLSIQDPLVVQLDPRPGRDPKWNRFIRTTVNLQVYSGSDGTTNVTSVVGFALFYLVRGDSAFFLPARSAARDSTRWYVSRWEDETAGASGAPGLHADPTRSTTFGDVKVLYVDPLPVAPAR